MKPYIIGIIGSVGAGKSSLASNLQNQLDAAILQEPWESNPYIPHLPSNGFSCQWKQMDLLLENHLTAKKLAKRSVVVMDRILHEVFEVFARQMRGQFTQEEFEALRIRYQQLKDVVPKVDVVVYLNADPQVCWERMKKRGRTFEVNSYPLAYFQDQAFLQAGLASSLRQTCCVIEAHGNASEEAVKTETLRKLRAYERHTLGAS